MEHQLQTKKLGADCTKELHEEVTLASQIERRKISDFIRLACEERAKKAITDNKKIKEQKC